jgi:hypothetical protein
MFIGDYVIITGTPYKYEINYYENNQGTSMIIKNLFTGEQHRLVKVGYKWQAEGLNIDHNVDFIAKKQITMPTFKPIIQSSVNIQKLVD